MPSLDQIRKRIPQATWSRGEAYQRKGLATVTKVSDGGRVIDGRVKGTLAKPYQTRVVLPREPRNGFGMTSSCSCPVGEGCKHAVALLLQAMADGVLDTAGGNYAPSPVPPAKPQTSADLPPDLMEWVTMLAAARDSATEEYPPEISQRVIYVVRPPRPGVPNAHRVGLVVAPRSVRLLRSGALSGTHSPLRLAPGALEKARFLRPSDRAILRDMAAIGLSQEDIFIRGTDGAAAFEQIVATGRGRWESVEGPVLVRGPARPGLLQWTLRKDATQVPDVVLRAPPQRPCRVLLLAPPWYVEDGPDGTMICGPVEVDMQPHLLSAVLSVPAVPLAEVPRLREHLTAVLPQALPAPLAPPRVLKGPPTPRLLILEGPMMMPFKAAWGGGMEEVRVRRARLSFLYEGVEVSSTPFEAVQTLGVDGGVVEIRRHRSAEEKALARLRQVSLEPFERGRWDPLGGVVQDLLPLRGAEDSEDFWFDFLLYAVEDLRADGWVVDLDDSLTLRPRLFDGTFEGRLESTSGVDWFDLHIGVTLDGQSYDILPALLAILRDIPPEDMEDVLDDDEDDDRLFRLPLGDGPVAAVPFGRVRSLLKALTGLFLHEGKGASLAPLDAVALADLEAGTRGAGLLWSGGESLRTLAARLREPPRPALPPEFRGSLRPYQEIGVAWMQVLREVGLGGVLADDMGLGKTVQTLAHLCIEKHAGRLDRPCLVVAPTSLMATWRSEAATFAPHLRTLILQGPTRKALFGEIAAHDLVVTTYPLLPHDAEVLTAQEWHILVLDEAQTVKNPATAAAKTLRRLTARHRLGLTGTPVENSLGDAWALFDVVSPGLLGDRRQFTRQWRTPIEKHGDSARQAALARRLRVFLLRRTKAAVAGELPEKTEIVEHVDLTPEQRAAYEGIRIAMHRKVRDAIARKGLARSRIELLEALLRLRQVCCEPRLIDTPGKTRRAPASAKLTRLMEIVPEMIAEGRRILLFSQFTSMLTLIEAEMQARGIPYEVLTGQTVDRETPVRRFQQGEVPVFLISLKAGGTGLTLTAADTVIHYDPWWNPAVEAQATDRAHRIGQDKPVFVHKLIAEDTVEVKIQSLKARKQALADGLFDPEGRTPFDFDTDDVDFLLGGSDVPALAEPDDVSP